MEFGLTKNKYFLQVTRFEPDNLPLENAQAFIGSGLGEKGYKFAIVGYKDPTPYALELNKLSGIGGVVILPAVYDPLVLSGLRSNCFSYVHGNSVGGTNPALLEAMAACPRVMTIDNAFSHELLGVLGLFFTPKTIKDIFSSSLTTANQHEQLFDQVSRKYQWQAVSRCYADLVETSHTEYIPQEI